MRVLVTGALGMLGREVVKTLEIQSHEVWATDISSEHERLDITRQDEIKYALSSFRPDCVANCAAYTNVDAAEDNEEQALMLNAKAPDLLAEACRKISAKLVHISTDYVFDGTKGSSYSEEDTPNPINVYGASKLAGENAIRHQIEDYIIVRTQWLIGIHGKNFVSTILKASQMNRSIRVVNDQWGSPTFATDLAKAVVLLMEINTTGVYHVCNRGKATWYDLACKAIEMARLDTEVIPVPTDEFPRPAKRPPYSVLSTKKFTAATGKLMPIWQSSLESFIQEEVAAGKRHDIKA